MTEPSEKDQLTRYIAIAGIVLSSVALGLNFWTARAGQQRQKQIDDIQIQQTSDRAFDLLGGNQGALWVHATQATAAERARLEEARRLLDNEVLFRRPEDARGLELKGIYLAKVGRVQDAIQQFQHVTQSHPSYYKGFCSLATAIVQADKPLLLDEADVAVSHCLALQPDYALGHNLRGSIRQQKGDLVVAEASYRRAIELEPTYAPAYTNLAGVFHTIGRHEDEEKWNRQAIDIDPSFGPAHYNLAQTLEELKRPKEAAIEFRRAQELGTPARK